MAGFNLPRRGVFALGAVAGISSAAHASGEALSKIAVSDAFVDLAEFGYAGDWNERTGKGTDDTAAWRAGIAAANERNIGRILVPEGASGGSYVAGSVCDGPLPAGLVFEAQRPVDTEGTSGARLIYGGSATCWNVDHRGRGGSEGRWTFRGIGFRTLDPGATMFDFNRAAHHGTVLDNDPQKFSALENIRFESCWFRGAGGGQRQTGDAIRGAKLFQFVIDETSFIRDFRRGVWLYGCDNCSVAMRSFLCARSVMVEASGTFGNDNRIESRFLGGSPAASSEDVYFIWDNGNSTAIHETYLEELDNRTATALVYLDGYETILLRPHFAGGPSFRLGPRGREITMIAPSITRHQTFAAPVFDLPASWDFGFEQTDYRILVVGATHNVQLTFGAHPRLQWFAPLPTPGSAALAYASAAQLTTAFGTGPGSRILSALNWWGRAAGTVATGGIAGLTRDGAASTGWAIWLSGEIKQGGLATQFSIGRDIFVGENLRVRIRYRSADTSGWLSVIASGARGFDTALNLGRSTGAAYEMAEFLVDLSGWQAGETLEHFVYVGAPNRSQIWIDFIEYTRMVPD